MAVLTNDQLDKCRQETQIDMRPSGLSKTQVNAALQAIETWYQANKTTISTSIDAAILPGTMTSEQKKKLGAWYFYIRFITDK